MKNLDQHDSFDIPRFKEEELFEVPEAYFDSLADNALKRARAEEKAKKWKNRWLLFASSAAACAVILVSLILFYPTEKNTGSLASITDTLKSFSVSIKEIVDNQCVEIEDAEFVANLPTENSKSVHKKTVASVKPESENLACNLTEDEFCALDYQILDYYDEMLQQEENLE